MAESRGSSGSTISILSDLAVLAYNANEPLEQARSIESPPERLVDLC